MTKDGGLLISPRRHPSTALRAGGGTENGNGGRTGAERQAKRQARAEAPFRPGPILFSVVRFNGQLDDSSPRVPVFLRLVDQENVENEQHNGAEQDSCPSERASEGTLAESQIQRPFCGNDRAREIAYQHTVSHGSVLSQGGPPETLRASALIG